MSPAERSAGAGAGPVAASGSGASAPSDALAAASITAVGGPTPIPPGGDAGEFREPPAHPLSVPASACAVNGKEPPHDLLV